MVFQLKFQVQTTPVEINTSATNLKGVGLIAASFDFLDQFTNKNYTFCLLHPDVPGGPPSPRRERTVLRTMQPHPVGYSPVLPISSGISIFLKKCPGQPVFQKSRNPKNRCSDIFQSKCQFQTTPVEINTSPKMLKWLGLIAVSFDFWINLKTKNHTFCFLHLDVPGGPPDPRQKRRVLRTKQPHTVGYSPVLPISLGVSCVLKKNVCNMLSFGNPKNKAKSCSDFLLLKFQFQTTAMEINASPKM
jgi:hypothetical protein